MTEEHDLAEDQQEELFEHHRFTVDRGQSPLRIDKFLFAKMGDTSRNRIQNACIVGTVLVNDKVVKPSYKVKPLDVIRVVLPTPVRSRELIPENIPIKIVYEDDEIIIVNKDAGMVVHPAYGHYSGTLMNALVWHFQNLPKKSHDDIRPGLVHRIDKNTSGIMVIAKNEISLTYMAKLFFDRTIDRKYIALVWGNPSEDSGTITGNIGRNIRNRKIMDIFPEGEHGKHAVTHYKVLERFSYVSLIECKLETGRTHQIRVHLKSIGHPLFNDNEYGGDKILKGNTLPKYKQFIENCFALIPGQALHAKTLGFKHPAKKENLFFDSELPEGFQQLIEKWRNYIA